MDLTPKVVVLGLDGGTFDVVEPWVRAGELPTFAELMRKGSRGRLRSTIPPVTPLAWPSIYTGTNPGKHGLFGFEKRLPGAYEWTHSSSLDMARPTLWDIAGRHGVRSGVFFAPYTFPAHDVNGWLVAGRGAPPRLSSRHSHPAHLAAQLADSFGETNLYGPQQPPGMDLSTIRSGLLRAIDSQTDAVVWAMKEEHFDLLFVVWDQTDNAAHLLWHFSDGGCPDVGSPMFAVYEAVDRAMGRVLDAVGGDPLVIVCSDHGAYPIRWRVRIPQWLEKNGFLKTTRGMRARLTSLGGQAWQKAPSRVKSLVPQAAKRSIHGVHDDLIRQGSLTDWSQTKVYTQPIIAEAFHVNLEGREPGGTVPASRLEEAVSRLEGSLDQMTAPDGARMVEGASRNREVYRGPQSVNGPDLIAHVSRGVYFSPTGIGELYSSPPRPNLDTDLPQSLGYHDPEGILMVAGPGVKPGEGRRASVTDIAPTILRHLDIPCPSDVDGTAIEAAFETLPAARFSDEDVGAPGAPSDLSDEEEKLISQHLQDLGYIE